MYEKISTFSVTILKHNRVWSQLEVTANGRTKTARAKKETVSDIDAGKPVNLRGYLEYHSDRYKTIIEFIRVSKEEEHSRDIQKWIGYLRDTWNNKGYLYERAVSELHKLDCHDYDNEIAQIREKVQKQKVKDEIAQWWRYFCDDKLSGRYYDRAVRELHDLGCHDYDDEIEAARIEIERVKKQEQTAGKAKVRLVLSAYRGFNGKPRANEKFIHNGVPYRVVSSYYHNEDGLSFGAMTDEWYEVWAYNISASEEGKKMIADYEEQKAQARKERDRDAAIRNLSSAISSLGKIYSGPELLLSDLENRGKVLIDTFDIYGFGEKIIISDPLVWLIVNNGSDGANWGINNIVTAGAGAYGYSIAAGEIMDKLTAVRQLLE